MKRENQENLCGADSFYQQNAISNGEQNHDSTEAETNQNNGPINPAKRQRRSDDEEIRLLIPSKV